MARTNSGGGLDVTGLPIGVVARDLGLSQDLLRKWETRYGFPEPGRNTHGERVYPQAQVDRLRLIKRLLDAGLRPAHVVPQGDAALRALINELAPPSLPAEDGPIKPMFDLLREHDVPALEARLQAELLRGGLEAFVRDVAIPMTEAVGRAWSQGELDVFEEHIYTEAIGRLLRNGIAEVSHARGRPRVVLTTLPDERHGLGLLFVAAMLSQRGARCLSLGTEMPIPEIARVVRVMHADIVGLSFSSVYPHRLIGATLRELRGQLGEGPEIWAGGAGVANLQHSVRLRGVRLFTSIDDAQVALTRWCEVQAQGL